MKEDISGLSKLLKKRNRLRQYLLGFIDAEGCFSISLKKQKDTRFGWVLDPIFQVTQHATNKIILEQIKNELSCGRIIEKPGQQDTLIYVVDNRRQLIEKVIPFFNKYQLVVKFADFERFKQVVLGLETKEHKNKNGFIKLMEIAFDMNLKGKQRKHKIEEIVRTMK